MVMYLYSKVTVKEYNCSEDECFLSCNTSAYNIKLQLCTIYAKNMAKIFLLKIMHQFGGGKANIPCRDLENIQHGGGRAHPCYDEHSTSTLQALSDQCSQNPQRGRF